MKQVLFVSFLIGIFLIPVYSQEDRKIELTAQGILARVDSILAYPRGKLTGKLKHITPDGKSYSVNIVGFIEKNDFLFTLSNRIRGKQLKILYNLGGEEIWVYNILSVKLYNKRAIDKYDPVLNTNFTFIDLSNADLQSNYTATISGDAYIKNQEAFRLTLQPNNKGGRYGKLVLYVTKVDYIPLRIDYYDKDNAIFKFMTITKVKKRKNKIIPIRYDMMNIRRGTVSILSFYDFDTSMKFDKNIFRSNKLGE